MTRRARASLGQFAFPADVDVDPAARVDPVAFGFERSQHLGDLGQPFGAPQDRADDLAFVAAVAVVDRAVGFGLPARGQVRDLDPVAGRVRSAGRRSATALSGAIVSISTPKVSSLAFIVCVLVLGGCQSPRNSGHIRSFRRITSSEFQKPVSPNTG